LQCPILSYYPAPDPPAAEPDPPTTTDPGTNTDTGTSSSSGSSAGSTTGSTSDTAQSTGSGDESPSHFNDAILYSIIGASAIVASVGIYKLIKCAMKVKNKIPVDSKAPKGHGKGHGKEGKGKETKTKTIKIGESLHLRISRVSHHIMSMPI